MALTLAIIVAGGSGKRMHSETKKQYLLLDTLPVLSHTLLKFLDNPSINQINLVVPENDFDYCLENIIRPVTDVSNINMVRGGSTRQESVYNGLKAINESHEIVVIHDGVRPFVTAEQIRTSIQVAEEVGACILADPAIDTIKNVDNDGFIINTIQRTNVWLAQTPQTFKYHLINEAHEHAHSDGFTGTDDASLLEYIGVRVKVIPGSPDNIKITKPEDLIVAQNLLTASV